MPKEVSWRRISSCIGAATNASIRTCSGFSVTTVLTGCTRENDRFQVNAKRVQLLANSDDAPLRLGADKMGVRQSPERYHSLIEPIPADTKQPHCFGAKTIVGCSNGCSPRYA